jgi:tetratricopeptide (TPR) repeat protein
VPNLLFAQNQPEVELANEYFFKGDRPKALELYRDLSKNENNIPYIHNNFLVCLLEANEGEEALSYLKRQLRKDPENIQFQLDVGITYVRMGDLPKGERTFKDVIGKYKENFTRIKMVSDYLASRSLAEYSIVALLESRQAAGNPYLFCLELASLYRLSGQKDKMVGEYLAYVMQNSANVQYVKNVLQVLLTKPDELESLEALLYDRVQKYPDLEVYSDLLIWVTMQQKNFYAAFVQARAYDRRYKKFGEKCMDVARVALDNKDFDNAQKSYAYVAQDYPGGPFFLQAQLGVIKSREARIQQTFPVSTDSVKSLVQGYQQFNQLHNESPVALEAQRSEALLRSGYLSENVQAIELLQQLLANPRASLNLKSRVKLDLGDIYLLQGEPWESALLYAQVEKALQESPLGYEAKLRNAKLSYYKADFRLAQEHLDILKEATTRDIANDAMELSMRIKENIAFDSAAIALRMYAEVEMLLIQNQTDKALVQIEALKQGRGRVPSALAQEYALDAQGPSVDGWVEVTYTNAGILDDVYWLEANLRLKMGEFDKALVLLQKILADYPEGILADDAFFLQAEIHDRHFGNKDKAMELYRELLNRFPGSAYAAEARMRYRVLRGDFL